MLNVANVGDFITRSMLASAGISCCHVFVCLSIRHKLVFCWNC